MKTRTFFTLILFLGLHQFAFSQANSILAPLDSIIFSTQTKTEEEPNPERFVFVQEQPKPINMHEVQQEIGYPQKAREKRIEGEIQVRILVSENGRYIRHIVKKSVSDILLKEVERVIPSLIFTPAISNGKPIKFWVNIPFRFKL